MSFEITNVNTKPVIDLNGSQGNAAQLLAYASQFSRELGFDKALIIQEMQESNYSHLVKTFDKYFGEYVILKMSEELAATIISEED